MDERFGRPPPGRRRRRRERIREPEHAPAPLRPRARGADPAGDGALGLGAGAGRGRPPDEPRRGDRRAGTAVPGPAGSTGGTGPAAPVPAVAVGATARRRFRVDPRYLQAGLATTILVVGQALYGTIGGFDRLAVELACALGADIVLSRLYKGRWPNWA